MSRKRTRKDQGGKPKKQKTNPDVKIRKSKTQKKISSENAICYNNEQANFNLTQWVSYNVHQKPINFF